MRFITLSILAMAATCALAHDLKLKTPLRFEYNSYMGWSNLGGRARFSDGFWAGSGTAYPSVAGLTWEPEKGISAKVALGTGGYYNGTLADQPCEAWIGVPVGKAKITAGKYWVPFAGQEWQYETKPGVMVGWESGSTTLSVSGQYDERTKRNNFYSRLSQNFGSDAYVGLSFGWGRGLSFGSSHNRGWAIDGGVESGNWALSGEYMGLDDSGQSEFRFGYAKLAFNGAGRIQPFVANYSWNDAGGFFGRFRSTVYGLNYQVTPYFSIEAATAPTSAKQVSWLQFHWGYRF